MFKYNKDFYNIVKNFYDSQKTNFETNGTHPAFEADTIWSIIQASLKKWKLTNLDVYNEEIDYRRLIIQIIIDLQEAEEGTYETGNDNMGSSLDSAYNSLDHDAWYYQDEKVAQYYIDNLTGRYEDYDVYRRKNGVF